MGQLRRALAAVGAIAWIVCEDLGVGEVACGERVAECAHGLSAVGLPDCLGDDEQAQLEPDVVERPAGDGGLHAVEVSDGPACGGGVPGELADRLECG